MLRPATKRQDAAFIRFRCPHRKEERTPVTLSQIQHFPFGPGHHLKLQRAPLHDVGMFQHITIQFMSVQLHGFHIDRTGSALTLHHDGELLSTGQHDFRMIHRRASYHILSRCRIYRIETEGSEDIPSRHLAAVVVARITGRRGIV